MEIDFPAPIQTRIDARSRVVGVSPSDLVRMIVAEKMADMVSATDSKELAERPHGCLVPNCENAHTGRGLCRGHYMKMRYYLGTGKLNEGWCVRHGRILPARGKGASDYAKETESLETLPEQPPKPDDDVRWMFGWPTAQQERTRMEGTSD